MKIYRVECGLFYEGAFYSYFYFNRPNAVDKEIELKAEVRRGDQSWDWVILEEVEIEDAYEV